MTNEIPNQKPKSKDHHIRNRLLNGEKMKHKRLTLLLLITTSTGIYILLDRGSQINFGEISRVELRLLHHLLDVRFLEDGASNWRAIATLVAGVILNIKDGLGIGGRDNRFLLRTGGANDPVLYGTRDGQFVLWICTRAGDLPRLLDVAL